MPRPDRDPIAFAHSVLRQLDRHITIDEVRALAACSDTCGLSLGKWILECAQVQAAQVIDAAQATERKVRALRREANSGNPENARRRRERKGAA